MSGHPTTVLTQQQVQSLGRELHDVFCDFLISEGYVFGEQTDDLKREHSALRAFDDLPEDEKEQNYDAARQIEAQLRQARFRIVKAESAGETTLQIPTNEIEKLAQLEHDRWLNLKRSKGWQWAPESDKSAKKHKLLVEWSQLKDSDKKKDRLKFAAIPAMLARLDLALERVP